MTGSVSVRNGKMANLKVYNQKGDEVGEKDFDATVFGKLHKQTMFEAVVMYEANQRLGTHCTKTRAQVAGTGKKPFRQKGTGRARQGSFQSPLRVGGGVAHGPKPRDYSYQLPRKQRRVATRSAILSKFMDDQVILVDKFDLEKPNTRAVVDFLNKFREKIAGKYECSFEEVTNAAGNTKRKKVKKEITAPTVSAHTGKPLSDSFLFVIGSEEKDKALYLSSRNIKWVDADKVADLNAWNVLRYTMMVVTEKALEELVTVWKEKK